MAPPKASVSKKQAVKAKATNAKTSNVNKATSKKSTNKDDTARSSTVKRPRADDQDEAPNDTRQKRSRKLDAVAQPSQSQSGTARSAKAKATAIVKAPVPATKPIINTRPSQKLNIFVFGEGRFGELGLGNQIHDGKKPMNVKRPRLNHNLLPDKVGVVQIAIGGMHTVALTADNKILTWGVNDLKALGREPVFEDPGSDLDDSDDENEGEDYKGLDLGESTPGEVDFSALGEVPQFVQVAATDSASFALTETGDVYGWGTFRVRNNRDAYFVFPS